MWKDRASVRAVTGDLGLLGLTLHEGGNGGVARSVFGARRERTPLVLGLRIRRCAACCMYVIQYSWVHIRWREDRKNYPWQNLQLPLQLSPQRCNNDDATTEQERLLFFSVPMHNVLQHVGHFFCLGHYKNCFSKCIRVVWRNVRDLESRFQTSLEKGFWEKFQFWLAQETYNLLNITHMKKINPFLQWCFLYGRSSRCPRSIYLRARTIRNSRWLFLKSNFILTSGCVWPGRAHP